MSDIFFSQLRDEHNFDRRIGDNFYVAGLSQWLPQQLILSLVCDGQTGAVCEFEI